MRVAVVGCGHVGLVTAATLAEAGHEVVGFDTNPDRVALLRAGTAPFYEPGLQELLDRLAGGSLRFAEQAAESLADADIAFICVNTPPKGGGRLNLVYVERAARTIAQSHQGRIVLVEKSTVPVQTARRIIQVLDEEGRDDIDVVCNPEFLREGMAVHDSLEPDRIIVGLGRPGRAEAVMRELYTPIVERSGCTLVVTDLETAEMIKHASNSFLAMRVSFINAVAELCERSGADIDQVARGMGLDPRIGPHFLQAGVGYGGSCFPKDVAAFVAYAADLGMPFGLLDEVSRINVTQADRLVEKVRRAVWNLEDKLIAVWGLSFKPGTDDLREAPSLRVIPSLLAEGARVRAYDPAAGAEAKSQFADVEIASDAMASADGADALVVLTDWPEFAGADLARLKQTLAKPVVVDGRNIWTVEAMRELGFTYLSFGRPDVIGGRSPR